jgi:hypothetical protein
MTDAVNQPLAGDGHDPEYARNDLDRLRDQKSNPHGQEAQIR